VFFGYQTAGKEEGLLGALKIQKQNKGEIW